MDNKDFIHLKKDLSNHVNTMCKSSKEEYLYSVKLPKGLLWNVYLKNLPSNIKQEHNCSCCRDFIERYGGIVKIDKDYNLVSIWDFQSVDKYQHTLQVMGNLVKNYPIKGVFLTDKYYLGEKKNEKTVKDSSVTYEDGRLKVITTTLTTHKEQEHLGCIFPFHMQSIKAPRAQNEYRKKLKVVKSAFKNTLDGINISTTTKVFNTVYQFFYHPRFNSKVIKLEQFLKLQKKYKELNTSQQDAFCWALNRMYCNEIYLLLHKVQTQSMDDKEILNAWNNS